MWQVTSFYGFVEIENPQSVSEQLHTLADRLQLRGLIILAKEGYNAGFACESSEGIQEVKEFFRQLGRRKDLDDKDSVCERPPFKDFQTKIRPEIVSLGRTDIVPREDRHRKLNAAEWDDAIAKGAYLLDTRNLYETRIGTFRGASLPAIDKFSEFPEEIKKNPPPKDRPVLIFCTGGIRCEKAIYALEEQGYDNVYQLDGGILRYLEETGGGNWQGECFVFDRRVAVTTSLENSTTYSLCPLCGSAAEVKITCVQCGKESRLCPDCQDMSVCSKNCRYHHYERHQQHHKTGQSAEHKAKV